MCVGSTHLQNDERQTLKFDLLVDSLVDSLVDPRLDSLVDSLVDSLSQGDVPCNR